MPNQTSSDPLVDQFCGLITDPDMVQQSYQDWLKHPNALGEFNLKGSSGPPPKRLFQWEITRKVNDNKDTLNYPQEIGDCTSFGYKNGGEYLQLLLKALGKNVDFKPLFPPYFYGAGRVFVGGQKGSNQDGATGGWMAKAVMKYGVLASDTEGCPKYAGKVAKEWGRVGPPANFVPVGQKNLIKSTALVNNIEAAKDALANHYTVPIASNYGFDMKQRSDGLMYHSTTWNHEMFFLGWDDGEPDGSIPAHAAILNNWGPDIHGQIIDFRTKEPWPKGTLRVPLKDISGILSQNDSYALSDMDYFEARSLPFDFFKPWSVN